MYRYYYDGSLEGLLSVVFDAYLESENIEQISPDPIQPSLNPEDIYVETDQNKADRVERYIKEKISKSFFEDIKICFLSCHPQKDYFIVLSIYKVMKFGRKILNSMDEDVFAFQKLIKQVMNERHRYLGLLRFRELKDGILFATMEPKNNVLPALALHFKKRFPNERFAIYDKKRKMVAYYDLKEFQISKLDEAKFDFSDEELYYNELWKTFHKSISIPERENRRLQQSQMPKYYQKHLIEEID